jgi:hypothetical protein
MNAQRFEGNYGEEVVLDLCHTCNGIWFDDKESLRLSPRAVLELVKLIHEKGEGARSQIAQSLLCPRCGDPLALTNDMQRNTRFNYFRCPAGHGHFITFFQFLREKNIIRSLELKQLNELKRRVKVIRCSNCGAPVDLERSTACTYCQSPISILDPKEIGATLQELQKNAEQHEKVDPTVSARLVMDKLSVENFYKQLHHEHGPSLKDREAPGLIEAGLEALVDLINAFR